MRLIGEKAKRISAMALSLALGFAGGIATKDVIDERNCARASEAAIVPVEKVHEPERLSNRLITPDLWDIYADPLFVPVDWTIKPLPLMPLVSYPTEVPKVQTVDQKKELRIIAQVPGMNEKDVKVEASEHTVTIKAHKKQEEKDNSQFTSFDEAFEQSVHLPCKVDADKVQATVKDGVLTVTLPKKT